MPVSDANAANPSSMTVAAPADVLSADCCMQTGILKFYISPQRSQKNKIQLKSIKTTNKELFYKNNPFIVSAEF